MKAPFRVFPGERQTIASGTWKVSIRVPEGCTRIAGLWADLQANTCSLTVDGQPVLELYALRPELVLPMHVPLNPKSQHTITVSGASAAGEISPHLFIETTP